MKNDTNWSNIGIGIIGVAILGWFVIGFFHELGQAPWQFLTVFVALFGAFITYASNLNIQIRNEQKPKKTEIYEDMIDFYFELILAEKLGKQPKNEEEILHFFAEFTPKLILWGSDEVLKNFIDFRQVSANGVQDSNTETPMEILGKLFIAIRKDLGHQNSQLNQKNILGAFVNDIENL